MSMAAYGKGISLTALVICSIFPCFAEQPALKPVKTPADARPGDAPPNTKEVSDLTEMSLEEIMDIQVTSVSKKPEKRSGAAAAIAVITHEDIRRSGVTNIPDALRMVPGVSVAQLDSNKWAVTARGLNGRFDNKLLVLVDGRSVYAPSFSGVYWETLDLMLEDVDRIEVIRGPGGTLWGANAVNGVINIITKKAQDTQGGLLTLGGGTTERAFAALRYGGKWGERTDYRIYAKYFERDAGKLASGEESNDNWNMGDVGFRVDSQLGEDDALTIEGGLFATDTNALGTLPFAHPPYTRTLPDRMDFKGAHLLGRWSHHFADDSTLQLQLYYDHAEYEATALSEQCDTFDADMQHQFQAGSRNTIVWGLGFRYIQDTFENTQFASFNPRHNRLRLFSAFLSDDITLVDDRLRLTLGSKFEYNDYTGFEVQPSASLSWTPNDTTTLWAAVSRAVRTPNLAENFSSIASITAPLTRAVLQGNTDFASEELLAFELGYRVEVSPKLAFDAAAYYNIYENLRSVELAFPRIEFRPLPPHLLIPFTAENNRDARTYGFELAVDWAPADWWRSRAAYSFYKIKMDLHPKTIDIVSGIESGDTPQHQVYLMNSFDLPHDIELNWIVRYVDRLEELDVSDYLTMDASLNWRISKDVQFSVVGQNLLSSHHFEFAPAYLVTVPTQVERGAYAKLTVTF